MTIATAEVKPCSEEDRLQEVLIPFLAEAKPPMDKLDRLYTDLQRELTELLAYFGEKDGSIETLFGTIRTFAHGLQKAAAEMTRHALRDETDSTNIKPVNTVSTIESMSNKLDRHEAMLSAVTIKKPPPSGDMRSISKNGMLSPNIATMGRKKSMRGTLSRGEVDEAIRSIHGGVRRRERDTRERDTLSRGGGVRLSKMFLDGGQSIRGKDEGLPPLPKFER